MSTPQVQVPDAALDQVPAAVIAVDLERRITLWNRGAEELYGWPAAEVLGRSVREVILVGEEARADEVSATTRQGEVWSGEFRCRHRDGTSLSVYVRNAPLLDDTGRMVGTIGASMDAASVARDAGRREAALASATARAAAAALKVGRLQRLTAALLSARTTDDVVQVVLDIGLTAVGAAAGGVVLLDGDDAELVGEVGYAPSQHGVLGGHASVPAPVTDAVRSGDMVLVPDAEAFRRAYPGFPLDERFGARAVVPVPAAAGGPAVGVLVLSFTDERTFDEDDEQMLLAVARHCGQALERARLLAAERAGAERAAFLASASAALSTSLDAEEMLQALVERAVPRFGDYGVVHLAPPDGPPRVVAAAHRDRGVGDALLETAWRTPLDLEGDDALVEVFRTGRSVRDASVLEDLRRRAGDAGDESSLGAALVPRSAIAAPLLDGEAVLGTVAVARTAGERYDDADVRLLEDVAARAAVALRHARLYQREREAAVTLQRSLLPQQVPAVTGLRAAWRYLPGGTGVHVGGDWYDVVELEHGHAALLIGDVMGRGLRAAAVMGQLRASARAHADRRGGPAQVLQELDTAVSRLEQGALTTALAAVVDPATGRVSLASSGHLPPLLVPPDGEPTYLSVEPAPPLGVGTGLPETTRTVVPPGSALLLFTDGLVEERQQSLDDGMEQLRACVAALPRELPLDLESLCEASLTALGRSDHCEDDTAVLAVAVDGPGPDAVQGAVRLAATRLAAGSGPREARRVVERHLDDWEVGEPVRSDVLSVAGELVANALLHTSGDVGVVLRAWDGRVRVEVRDRDAEHVPLPSLASLVEEQGRMEDVELDAVIAALDQLSTTGRGMTVVDRLSDAWGVEVEDDGKSVWAEFVIAAHRAGGAGNGGSAATDGVVVSFRGVPVRLVLAHSADLDEVVRELSTRGSAPDPSAAVARVAERGLPLLERTSEVRDPLRTAARAALARGQRLVDVQVTADAGVLEAVDELVGLMGDVLALTSSGELLTAPPDPEVVAFRLWWVDELTRQVRGEPARPCPFPSLPEP